MAIYQQADRYGEDGIPRHRSARLFGAAESPALRATVSLDRLRRLQRCFLPELDRFGDVLSEDAREFRLARHICAAAAYFNASRNICAFTLGNSGGDKKSAE